MPHYRIYEVDKDGHIAGPAKIVECDDDGAAVAEARQLQDGHVVEIWEQNSLVVGLDREQTARVV